MDTILILMILAIPAGLFWSSGRSAAEVALLYGQRSCQRAGVQWLDQSAHMVAIRLHRNSHGWLGWERKFRFEYSHNGDDRYAGHVVLQGTELVGLVGPMPKQDDTEEP
jgi:hypothetical protein